MGVAPERGSRRRVAGRDSAPGEAMNRRLKLVAAPALSQSEPDSGLPRPLGGPWRHRSARLADFRRHLTSRGDAASGAGSPHRSVRAPRQGSAGLDHRPMQLPVRLLHAGRGHGLAPEDRAPHLRGDRPGSSVMRRTLRVRFGTPHWRRAARPRAHHSADLPTRTARRRHRDDDERREARRGRARSGRRRAEAGERVARHARPRHLPCAHQARRAVPCHRGHRRRDRSRPRHP